MIQIDNINFAGSELFASADSFLNELSETDTRTILGGKSGGGRGGRGGKKGKGGSKGGGSQFINPGFNGGGPVAQPNPQPQPFYYPQYYGGYYGGFPGYGFDDGGFDDDYYFEPAPRGGRGSCGCGA
jgi:hypothetical protein